MFAARIVVGLSAALSMLPTGAFADYWTDHQCVLEKPQPVFGKAGFRLDPKKGSATEAIALNENVSVHLEQRTCEYLNRTYTFILKEIPDDTNIVGWQYRKAIELLALLEARAGSRLKFDNEKKALDTYVQLVLSPREGEEINAVKPHDQFYELVSVSSRISEKDARIIVKVWSGPY